MIVENLTRGVKMATEKLYYQDAHQAAFEARVVSCQPGKHGYDVVLDRTCFYPEEIGRASCRERV